MLHCSDNVLGPGGAGGHGVTNDPPVREEASLEATMGHQASDVEDDSHGVEDDVDEDSFEDPNLFTVNRFGRTVGSHRSYR